MRSLFLKIFLSYWLAQALFVVLAILVTLAVRPQTDPRGEYFRINTAMQAAQAYEHGGKAQVANQLEERERSVHDRVFLFDDQGRELSGRRVPQWALQLAAGVQPKPAGLWGRLEGDRRAAQAIVAPSGKRYTLVIERPAPPHFFFGPNRTPGLGIFIAILSSGLVCLRCRYGPSDCQTILQEQNFRSVRRSMTLTTGSLATTISARLVNPPKAPWDFSTEIRTRNSNESQHFVCCAK